MRVIQAAAVVCLSQLATVAWAQESKPQNVEAPISVGSAATQPHFIVRQSAGHWRASKLVGLKVYNEASTRIGDINEILLDRDGAEDIVVIGVGGFLGIGEKDVAVPFRSLSWTNETPHTSTTRTPIGTSPTATGLADSAVRSPSRTPTVVDRGYPDHAILKMTKAELKEAPAFRFVGGVE